MVVTEEFEGEVMDLEEEEECLGMLLTRMFLDAGIMDVPLPEVSEDFKRGFGSLLMTAVVAELELLTEICDF